MIPDPRRHSRQVILEVLGQLLVFAATFGVPLYVWFELSSLAHVDLSFDRDHIIRLNRNPAPREFLQETGQIAAGVDHPNPARLLKLRKDLLQLLGKRRLLELTEQRPVEISRSQFDRPIHFPLCPRRPTNLNLNRFRRHDSVK